MIEACVIHSQDVVFDEISLGFKKEQMKDLDGINQPAVEIDVSTEEPYSEEPSTVLHHSERTQQCPNYYRTWIYTAKEQRKGTCNSEGSNVQS